MSTGRISIEEGAFFKGKLDIRKPEAALMTEPKPRATAAIPFGWHEVSADKLRDIRSKLAGIEGNTWKEILVRDAKYNHFIAVDKICPEARERLQALRMDDTDSLLSLRLAGTERIWGILQLNVLQMLWWDPEHLVYPVNIADN